MSRTRIKICGLRDADTIRAMDGLPVDEVGFVFAKSKRQVTPEAAASLVQQVSELRGAGDRMPRAVGVFVDPSIEQVREVLAGVRLGVVQLHGQESPEQCRSIRESLGVQVWKVFAIRGGGVEAAAADLLAPYTGSIDAAMIDTAGGGTGSAFDWTIVDAYKAAAEEIGVPLYVAGGLHADNVQELVRGYRPDGVDVSSGVETEGMKDIAKIIKFVERVTTA
jgi:phosphoribosylanthranilate isomerase